jgi:hypothetical protein
MGPIGVKGRRHHGEGLQQLHPQARQPREPSSTDQAAQLHHPQQLQWGHGGQQGWRWRSRGTGEHGGRCGPPPGEGEHHGESGEQHGGQGLGSQPGHGDEQQHRISRRRRGIRFHGIEGPQAGAQARPQRQKGSPEAAGDGSRLDRSMVPVIQAEGYPNPTLFDRRATHTRGGGIPFSASLRCEYPVAKDA